MSRQRQRRRRQNAISSAYYDVRSFYANRRSFAADMGGREAAADRPGPKPIGAGWDRAGRRYARDAISIKLRGFFCSTLYARRRSTTDQCVT